MTDQIRDLEHRFNVAGRGYILQVRAGEHSPAPVSAGAFEVLLTEFVELELLNDENVEPEKVVRQVVDHAKQFLPAGIISEQWGGFSDALCAWICEHRAAASIRDHESE